MLRSSMSTTLTWLPALPGSNSPCCAFYCTNPGCGTAWPAVESRTVTANKSAKPFSAKDPRSSPAQRRVTASWRVHYVVMVGSSSCAIVTTKSRCPASVNNSGLQTQARPSLRACIWVVGPQGGSTGVLKRTRRCLTCETVDIV